VHRARHQSWTRRDRRVALARAGVCVGAALTVALLSARLDSAQTSTAVRPYSVGLERLDAAVHCATQLKRGAHPVLLVPGGQTSAATWSTNWLQLVPRLGRVPCTVDLPDDGQADIQLSAEYVARALQVLHDTTRERTVVIGHSQGGLIARSAIEYFPQAAFISELVQFATPNHGMTLVDQECSGRACAAAAQQMRPAAKFIAALNAMSLSQSVSIVSIYSTTDHLIMPISPPTAEVPNGTTVAVQEICPTRSVDHNQILSDNVAVSLALDALRHAGTLDLTRVRSRVDCKVSRWADLSPSVPSSTRPPRDLVTAEPALASYAARG
jgi:pimeloyl-ACP methyl ester carboxylesterase